MGKSVSGPHAFAVIGGGLGVLMWVAVSGALGAAGVALNLVLLGVAVALVVPGTRARLGALLGKPTFGTPWRFVGAVVAASVVGGVASLGAVGQARSAATTAERQKSERADAHSRALGEARSMVAVGRTADALAAFDRAAALGSIPATDVPAFASLLLTESSRLAAAGDPGRALSLVQKAIALPGLDAELAAQLDEAAKSIAEKKRTADAAAATRVFADAIECTSDHIKIATAYIKKANAAEAAANIGEVERCLGIAAKAKPSDPLLAKIETEVASLKHERNLLAERQAKADEAEHAGRLQRMLAELKKIGATAELVHSIELDATNENEVVVTVGDAWHSVPHQIRLQNAQAIWKTWAAINRNAKADASRLRLVDHMGNEVGGSRVFGGSAIWVQDE
jgi:tetratricopeptide (TPR) repeat protein